MNRLFQWERVSWDGTTRGWSRGNPWENLNVVYFHERDTHGVWTRRGSFHPADGHQPLASTYLPLRNGRDVLAIAASRWFHDGQASSPCARYAFDERGELRFQSLINPMPGLALPTVQPEGEITEEQPWSHWVDHLTWASSSQVLLVGSVFGGCFSLLDPMDGHVLKFLKLPDPGKDQRYFALGAVPTPDGNVWITAARSAEGWDQPQTEGGRLAAAHLGLIDQDVDVCPVMFRLNAFSFELLPQPLPMGVPGLLSHVQFEHLAFLPTANGGIECVRREMR